MKIYPNVKRGTMKKHTLIYLVLGTIFILLLTTLSLATEVDTGIECIEDLECEEQVGNGAEVYCDLLFTGNCIRVIEDYEESINTSTATDSNQTVAVASTVTTTTTPSTTQIDSLNTQIAVLETKLAQIETEIANLESQQRNLVSKQNQQESSIQTISAQSSQVKTELEGNLNNVATGLAGLQNDLNSTQSELETIEGEVAKERAFTKFLTYIFFILLAIAAALAVYYFINKQKPKVKVNQKVKDYITSHIKEGKKFPHIKESLLNAGWAEEDINSAYKETLKHNYKNYLQQKISSNETSGSNSNRTKIIAIVTISLLLLIGVLLMLSGTVGQAINIQRLVGGSANGTAGEVTYDLECTPPHIFTPEGDSCCLDENDNQKCDYIEEREGTLAAAGSEGQCNDNLQCAQGEWCLNGQCDSLSSIYQGKGDCSKMCNYYALKVKTSDGETYSVRPKRGSYTGAGALEWKIMEAPDHCKGEAAIVPITIKLKRPGETIAEEIITLSRSKTSKVLTHPDVPRLAFTLTLEEIYEQCPDE